MEKKIHIVVAVVNAHTHKKEKKYIEKKEKKRKEETVTTIYKSSEPTRTVNSNNWHKRAIMVNSPPLKNNK